MSSPDRSAINPDLFAAELFDTDGALFMGSRRDPSGWWSWTFAAIDGRRYLQPDPTRAAAVVDGSEIWSPRWQRGAFDAIPAAIERELNA